MKPLAQALFGVVIAEIEVSMARSQNYGYHGLLSAVIGYMESSIESEETLESLAQRFRISAGHLSYLFRARFNCSPRQYWLTLKLDRAELRLQQGLTSEYCESDLAFSRYAFESVARKLPACQ